MKLPRLSLRTMLIAIAIIAAVVGWLRYESQRGWTRGKLERLIEGEFNPDWNEAAFANWVEQHRFRLNTWEGDILRGYLAEDGGPIDQIRIVMVDQNVDNSIFFHRSGFLVYFDYRRGHCISHKICKGEVE